ncbi:HAD-IC family P-type ATPase [Bdellovibrio sp. KM01]|uniref:cation-translocating P-type ATPase n=1 Tax=Bdellovibrio sp. KM01 TaxID=2748865 RepID=UPI0015E9569E|nr:HAD-IC family P-type ATPase [Bdellovibrio sp. KM01]QLY26168.1 HAD-IC family P-type ATPase [Bdellovibrio sp. KM01]
MQIEKSREPYRSSIVEIAKTEPSPEQGLSSSEASLRLQKYGLNVFPTKKPKPLWQIFLGQFLSPLIYILLVAGIIAILIGDARDAIFIAVILLINSIIGTTQEKSAQNSALALRRMAETKSLVLRDGEKREIPSLEIVVGDVVLLESGNKVPADLRLLATHALEVDESLLTGESLTVFKYAESISEEHASLGDRKNMAFTGSLVVRGRGKGLVTAVSIQTELGKIANSLNIEESAGTPLLIRMEKLTQNIAISLLVVTAVMAGLLFWRGHNYYDVLVFSVALAVSAIPEGLPVALTVALAVASRRMAKKNVIVRKLPAVEALGSCNYIATDKTGTLTVNQLTVQKIVTPDGKEHVIEGSGLDPGNVHVVDSQLASLIRCGVLCNEAQLFQQEGVWMGHGDSVDLAFLVLGRKGQISAVSDDLLIDDIPFEPEHQYAATLHAGVEQNPLISAKGAVEKLLPMCDRMYVNGHKHHLSSEQILKQADRMAEAGYRVLALAGKSVSGAVKEIQKPLTGLTFYGLVGMIDPLRPDAAQAVRHCQRVGIRVAMVTGDHPKTSLAIARQLDLAHSIDDVVTGPALKKCKGGVELIKLISLAKVFARVEPQQKLQIVQSLIAQGYFVAVTGDGANDAPALKAANVGVAMGLSGTDVAKEAADLIVTDDKFSSIVAGVEQGRIVYNNLRKVVYLLISTAAAEMLIFVLSIIFDTPMPLTAAQILWLNLVTNGIQDIGLSFEPGEGDELDHRPRRPNEPIFDRLMLERVILSAVVIGGMGYWYFHQLLQSGIGIDMARNDLLLFLVLFENLMLGNCRSEEKSIFKLNPLRNPFLLGGAVLAQGIHIAAMYTPGLSDLLGVGAVPVQEWVRMLMMAISVLAVIEIHKLIKIRGLKARLATG